MENTVAPIDPNQPPPPTDPNQQAMVQQQPMYPNQQAMMQQQPMDPNQQAMYQQQMMQQQQMQNNTNTNNNVNVYAQMPDVGPDNSLKGKMEKFEHGVFIKQKINLLEAFTGCDMANVYEVWKKDIAGNKGYWSRKLEEYEIFDFCKFIYFIRKIGNSKSESLILKIKDLNQVYRFFNARNPDQGL